MSLNRFLTSANATLGVTNLSATSATVNELTYLPLGTAGGTATGEVGLKVIQVGGAGFSTVTANIVAVGASGSGTIPSGAKGWTIAFLTGTGTLGGVAVSAGFSDSDANTLAAGIAYTTNAASTAIVRYNT